MVDRQLPVRQNLKQLKHQAKDLLKALQRGDRTAVDELHAHHPERIEAAAAKLADCQLVLARSYGVPSWPRLVRACRLVDANWRDEADALHGTPLAGATLLHLCVDYDELEIAHW
jgi:hypothetical protein